MQESVCPPVALIAMEGKWYACDRKVG